VLAEGVDLLVSSPGRFLEHLRRNNVNLAACCAVVLDEVDVLYSRDSAFLEQVGVGEGGGGLRRQLSVPGSSAWLPAPASREGPAAACAGGAPAASANQPARPPAPPCPPPRRWSRW
jgi:hypothetical protein